MRQDEAIRTHGHTHTNRWSRTGLGGKEEFAMEVGENEGNGGGVERM